MGYDEEAASANSAKRYKVPSITAFQHQPNDRCLPRWLEFATTSSNDHFDQHSRGLRIVSISLISTGFGEATPAPTAPASLKVACSFSASAFASSNRRTDWFAWVDKKLVSLYRQQLVSQLKQHLFDAIQEILQGILATRNRCYLSS